jgi:hypothetical protein
MEIQFVKSFTEFGNRMYQIGDTAAMPDATAQKLIHYGIAVPVIRLQPQSAETAVIRKPRKEKRDNA